MSKSMSAEISSPKNFGHFSVIFKTLPKEKNRPRGENLPNLVTLFARVSNRQSG
jgi:hypothetical protein